MNLVPCSFDKLTGSHSGCTALLMNLHTDAGLRHLNRRLQINTDSGTSIQIFAPEYLVVYNEMQSFKFIGI